MDLLSSYYDAIEPMYNVYEDDEGNVPECFLGWSQEDVREYSAVLQEEEQRIPNESTMPQDQVMWYLSPQVKEINERLDSCFQDMFIGDEGGVDFEDLYSLMNDQICDYSQLIQAPSEAVKSPRRSSRRRKRKCCPFCREEL